MNAMKVIGFDMDYTLVMYDQKKLETLVFELAKEELIKSHNYPESIRNLSFNPDMIIRGLVIDKKLGNLLKINRFGYVKTAYNGKNFLSFENQKKLYSEEIINFSNSRYEMVHTMFSLSACSLFSGLSSHVDVKIPYEDIFNHVNTVIDSLHGNNVLKNVIRKNPSHYLIKNPLYAETLIMLKQFDKKLALITNSDWPFVKPMMDECYNPYLNGGKWEDLFDIIVVSSEKPAFFSNTNKFLEVDPSTGHLKNIDHITTGHIYQAGSAKGIEALFNVKSQDVLYVGDHIYSDILQSKKICKWRTMLVFDELKEELLAAEKGTHDLTLIRSLMAEKETYELELDQIYKYREKTYSVNQEIAVMTEADINARYTALKDKTAKIDEKISTLISAMNSHFNPHWGELMWAGNDKSMLASAIERFACIYTGAVSNLLYYSPVHYFRPKMKSYD